ncbi:multidrug export protein MepA [Methanobrevibacter cuticularis]|uniref:Multidrug export protein MepA n=1 Tax=Methanobrevibacter cuticularis TaxID=47311 RepID=A0A166F6G1_9EURY|nr:MATE family efflux transporter [Methanobrevibacter cuticularis]KZX17363.1 multidrug export protein MepA [Methanobrevibacter cuticularis]
MDNYENENHTNIALITGDPKRAIRKLAWPMMIAMFLTMAYNLADGIWVAGLGTEALAALGFATPLFMIVVGLGSGLGAGANSLIARYIGARNKKKADNAAIHSILLTIVISIILMIVLYISLKDLLLLMGAGDSIDLALEYGYIVFIGLFVFLFSNVGASVLRAEGDVNRAMYAMAITAILNIVIDPIFIYSLNMGMAGAAWATILSALISCIIIAYWLFIQKNTYLSFSKKAFNYSNKIMSDLLNVGLPASASTLIMSVLSMILNLILAIVAGNYGVAIFTAGWRILLMALIPHLGLGTAVLTVIGAGFGAKNYAKMSEGFNYAIKLGLIFAIIISIIVFVFAEQIALTFAYTEANVHLIPGIVDFLRIMTIFFITIPIGLIPTSTFQGVGKGLSSFIMILLHSLIFISIFSYLFAIVFNMGVIGVWWGLNLGGVIGVTISYIWVKIYLNKLLGMNSLRNDKNDVISDIN